MAFNFNICDTLHSFDDFTIPDEKSTEVKHAVKSILKTEARRETPYVFPDPPYFTCNYTKEAAIKRYQEQEESAVYPDKLFRYTFFNTRVVEFEKFACCSQLKPAGTEMVKETDPLEPIAAYVLDCLIESQEKRMRPLDLYGVLFDRLALFNGLSQKKRTIRELKAYVREQTQDLIERCEERLAQIPRTYVLTQRFMNHRAHTKVTGLNVSDKLLRILRDVIMPALVRG